MGRGKRERRKEKAYTEAAESTEFTEKKNPRTQTGVSVPREEKPKRKAAGIADSACAK
jgi:hypothetical protein